MEIKYSLKFKRQFNKANPKIKKAFVQRRVLFKNNQHSPLLRNHALTGSFKGYRSINVTGDWRAIYSEKGSTVVFELLGTHSQLYK